MCVIIRETSKWGEEELLGGKFLPELAYEGDLRKVSLHLFGASSGVQELWVILPILHQAMSDCEEGKRVFIEEPEALRLRK